MQRTEKQDAKLLLDALKQNFDITQFSIKCDDELQEIINIILERNKQFRSAQKILINQLLKNITATDETQKYLLDELRTINASTATADEVSYILFQLYLRSQFSNTELSSKVQQTIALIKKLKIVGINHGINALQASAALNHHDYVSALIQTGCDLESPNFRGETALDLAVIEGHFSMVKLLCENGASKTNRSRNGKSAFEYALECRRDDIASYLAPDASAISNKKYLAKRNLVIGFGVSIFDEINHERNIRAYNNGGSRHEGMALLTEYLKRFVDQRGLPKLQIIASQFQSSFDAIDCTPDELAARLNSKGMLFTQTGCLSHITGVSMHKLDNQTYRLTLSDRGLFMSRAPENSFDDRKPSLQSLTFPASALKEILNIIVAARYEELEQAEKMLFDDIPHLANSEWKYHANSLHSSLKSGTCFFSNLKPLLLDEFYNIFGSRYGKRAYKEFTLFLRTELLRDYEQFAEADDPYVFLAEQHILEKRAGFITSYM